MSKPPVFIAYPHACVVSLEQPNTESTALHSCDCSPFKGNEIRRTVVETVFPLLKYEVKKKLAKTQNVSDILLAKYDEIDNYLEMIIQFGVSLCVYVRTSERPACHYF